LWYLVETQFIMSGPVDMLSLVRRQSSNDLRRDSISLIELLEAGSPTSSKEAGESYAAAWKGGEL
jgi:hypothetical protein